MKTKMFVMVVTLGLVLGCEATRNRGVPDELIGVWKTGETRYTDRFFELKKNAVVFGTGGDSSTVHAILDIETEEITEENRTLYVIHYSTAEGSEYLFSFYYIPVGQTIQFRNQQQFAWTKWAKLTP